MKATSMNRIDQKFRQLKAGKKKALSAYLTAGFPVLSATERLIPELESSGADFFEIGFPFSDPIADGPTIQKSSAEALRGGLTWKKLLAMVSRIRKISQAPLILMTYSNALYCRGWKKSIDQIAAAGFDGAILPDMVPEESAELRRLFHRKGLHLIYLLAPTSSPDRIREVCRESSGFIYCVSVTGVTGSRAALPVSEIKSFLTRVKRRSRLPVLLGFGISKPGHIKEFKGLADGFIIGSALIKALDGKRSLSSLMDRAKNFITPFDKILSASKAR